MKRILPILVTLAAIVLGLYTPHDQLLDYMRGLLRPTSTAINNFSKSFKSPNNLSARNLTTMASTSKQWAGLPVIPPEDPSLNAVNPTHRSIQKVFEAIEQAEGAGATVRRSIGTPKLRNFTPFLMLDHFRVAPGAGFPDHPHRGQETITYLLEGAVDHEDFTGSRGVIESGDLQFMTAGRGIVHAEMPHDFGDGTVNSGMQRWVDLHKELKSCEARYRDLKAKEITTATADEGKVTIKVISGRSQGVDSLQELAYTPVWLLDVTIRPGGRLVQSLPAGWNAFAYTMEGKTTWNTGATKQEVPRYHNTVFEQKGDQVEAEVPANAEEAARFILVAGMPLDQPIVQYGPFVLTDSSQVRQAMFDYSTHTNGFERAANWESEIGKTMVH